MARYGAFMENHPLAQFLTKKGLTQEEFAGRIGIGQPSLSRVLRGQMRFSAKTARAVVKETGGAITLEELLFGRVHTRIPKPRRRARP